MCITDDNVLVAYQMAQPMKPTVVLDMFPVDWLYDPIVPDGPYADLQLDGQSVDGVDMSMEDGTLFGWSDVLGQALGIQIKRTRVPVRIFLKNHGATIPGDGWRPNEGQRGTLYATLTVSSTSTVGEKAADPDPDAD